MARMLSERPRLGAHLPIGDGMVRTADRAVEIGATALQVFSDNPTAWQRRAAPSPELAAFRARLAAGGIASLAIHASYLINLAGSDHDYHERSVALLASELRSARRFGATIVNVHIGSHGGAGIAAGIERLVAAVGRALEVADGPEPDEAGDSDEEARAGVEAGGSAQAAISLENSAGGGFGLGTDLDELGAIAEALDAAGIAAARVGFCLDTAHAWSAGHDLADPAATDALLDGFDRRIGLDRLTLVHVNDSKSELGSRLDRHQHVGAGRIGEAGMAHLLRHPRLAHATWILETPGMDEGYDAVNMARAIALARGEPLDPLPPGALSLRGSRSRATMHRAATAEPAEARGASGPTRAHDRSGAP
jgi:deoxyribonuclease-4